MNLEKRNSQSNYFKYNPPGQLQKTIKANFRNKKAKTPYRLVHTCWEKITRASGYNGADPVGTGSENKEK